MILLIPSGPGVVFLPNMRRFHQERFICIEGDLFRGFGGSWKEIEE